MLTAGLLPLGLALSRSSSCTRTILHNASIPLWSRSRPNSFHSCLEWQFGRRHSSLSQLAACRPRSALRLPVSDRPTRTRGQDSSESNRPPQRS